MTPEIIQAANDIWDSVAERLPGDEGGYYDPEAVVSRALGISKRAAIAARRGYRRPVTVRRGPSMPRVSILDRPFEEVRHAA